LMCTEVHTQNRQDGGKARTREKDGKKKINTYSFALTNAN